MITRHLLPSFNLDNYSYQGRFSPDTKQYPHDLKNTLLDRDCFGVEDSNKTSNCWKNVSVLLEDLHNTSRNILLIEEFLEEGLFMPDLKKIVQSNWDILIIISYRRFFE